MLTCEEKNQKILILKNLFEDNDGFKGGAIFIENCLQVLLIENIFFRNRGQSGGALYIISKSYSLFFIYLINLIKSILDEILVKKCKFLNNSAFEGGALKYLKKRPVILQSLFENNVAQYGSDIASYPITSNFLEIINESLVIQNKTPKIDKVRPSKNYFVTNEKIIIGMFDYDQQIIENNEELYIFFYF